MKVVNFLIGIGNMVLSAFVACYLWNWFIVPLGVVEITPIHAYGIELLISKAVLKIGKDDLEGYETEEQLIRALALVATNLTFWGVGFLLHATMVA